MFQKSVNKNMCHELEIELTVFDVLERKNKRMFRNCIIFFGSSFLTTPPPMSSTVIYCLKTIILNIFDLNSNLDLFDIAIKVG